MNPLIKVLLTKLENHAHDLQGLIKTSDIAPIHRQPFTELWEDLAVDVHAIKDILKEVVDTL